MPKCYRYIKKRGEVWYTNFTVHGQRVRRSTGLNEPELAENFAIQLREQLLAPDTRNPQMTVDQALGRYWNEHAVHFKSRDSLLSRLRGITDYFGEETLLSELCDRDISGFIEHLRQPYYRKEGGDALYRSPATINRHLETLSSILRRASEHWGIETANINVRRHRLVEPQGRTRYLTVEEAERLMAASPPHLANIIRFALMTGLRKTNILSLRWEQVDWEGERIAFRIKSRREGGEAHYIPLYPELKRFLQSLGRKHTGAVFTYEGQAFNADSTIKRSFRTACRNAGLEDFRFHDLRHTCASWMVQRGVPLEVVKEALGHRNITTTMRYAHHKLDATRQAYDMMLKGTKLAHSVRAVSKASP